MTKSPSLFGIKLRAAIKKRRLTYTQAAEDIGVTLSFLNQLMRGERRPSEDTVSAICSALNVSRSYLYEEPMDSKSDGDLLREILSILATLNDDELEAALAAVTAIRNSSARRRAAKKDKGA